MTDTTTANRNTSSISYLLWDRKPYNLSFNQRASILAFGLVATIKKIMPSSNQNINKKNMGGWFTKVIAVPTKSGNEVINSSRTQAYPERNDDAFALLEWSSSYQDAQAVG